MSTILKALQKVEDNLRPQGKQSEQSDPFWDKPEEGSTGKSRPKVLRVGLLVLTLMGVLGGAGYWMYLGSFRGDRASQGNSGREPASVSRSPEQFDIQPLSPPGGAESAEVIEKAVVGKSPVLGGGMAATEKPAPRQVQQPGTDEAREEKDLPVAFTVQKERPLPQVSAVPPRIVVTGIAYQEDRSVRFAIVNDRALGEGEVVQGAVVKEILEDRVRFRKNGSTFEVSLSR